MSTYDLGDVVALGISVKDAAGQLSNATTVVCTIYLPDGTTATPAVGNEGTGLYSTNYTPTIVGRHQVRWVASGTNASAYTDEFTVRDFAQMGVVSLDEVKAHLNIPATSTDLDEEIRRFMDAANDLAEEYTGRVLGRRTITEIYDGSRDVLFLRTPCALSVTSVVENGVTLTANDYALDYSGMRLNRLGSGSLDAIQGYGWWARGARNITVTYVAGYTNPPAIAKQGVLEIVRHLWQTQRGAVSVLARNQAGDDFLPSSTYSVPRRVMELLDPLRIHAVGGL